LLYNLHGGPELDPPYYTVNTRRGVTLTTHFQIIERARAALHLQPSKRLHAVVVKHSDNLAV
jgi:hypothetical protein